MLKKPHVWGFGIPPHVLTLFMQHNINLEINYESVFPSKEMPYVKHRVLN